MASEQSNGVRKRGSAREVIDWISWWEHVDRVSSLCDTTETAIGLFGCFKQSASAQRGSSICEGISTV